MKRLLFAVTFATIGCAGRSTQPVATVPAAPNAGIAGAHASGGRLIYATSYGGNSLSFYSYRNGKLEGTITGAFSGPQGLCNDLAGNVWVANTNDEQMLEFAHGGTSPIRTLATGEFSAACAVSRQGTLAVANLCSAPSCGSGNVMLFAHESGSPTSVTCPNIDRYYFAGYDAGGNLYVDGESSSSDFALCKIPDGSSSGEAIALSQSPGFPGGVQWDGTYVAVLDQDADQIDRYALSGTTGTLKGTVVLGDISDPVTFVMNGKDGIISTGAGSASGFGFWHYPQGGAPYKRFTTGDQEPAGIAVSPPKKL
jgi:hypothetical protein